MFFSTRKSRKGQEGEGLSTRKRFEMFSSCIFLLFLLKLFFSTRKSWKGQEGEYGLFAPFCLT